MSSGRLISFYRRRVEHGLRLREEGESNRRRSTGRCVFEAEVSFLLWRCVVARSYLILFLLPLGSQGWLDSTDQEMVLTKPHAEVLPLVRRERGRPGNGIPR